MRGGSKRPQLSDLRESGAIEQDADIVAFIHRPEYYGMTQTEDGLPTAGMAEIFLAKQGNGEVCDVPLRFIKEQARFADTDDLALVGVNTAPKYEEFASASNSSDMGSGLASTPLQSSEFDIAPPTFNPEDAPF